MPSVHFKSLESQFFEAGAELQQAFTRIHVGNGYVFTVSGAFANPGSVYSNNSQLFTVVGDVNDASTILASGTGAPTSGSGTLTLESGEGDATIVYSGVSANNPLLVDGDTWSIQASNPAYGLQPIPPFNFYFGAELTASYTGVLVGTPASYTGTPTGASTPVTINSNLLGTQANITLTFTGSNSINDALLAWNNSGGLYGNIVGLASGNGAQIPTAGSISLTGGTGSPVTITSSTTGAAGNTTVYFQQVLACTPQLVDTDTLSFTTYGSTTIPNTRYAQKFTSLSSGGSYFVNDASFNIRPQTAGCSIFVELRTDSSGLPGSLVGTSLGTYVSPGQGLVTVDFNGTAVVNPATDYHLVVVVYGVEAGLTDVYIEECNTGSPGLSKSTNAGSTFTSQGASNSLQFFCRASGGNQPAATSLSINDALSIMNWLTQPSGVASLTAGSGTSIPSVVTSQALTGGSGGVAGQINIDISSNNCSTIANELASAINDNCTPYWAALYQPYGGDSDAGFVGWDGLSTPGTFPLQSGGMSTPVGIYTQYDTDTLLLNEVVLGPFNGTDSIATAVSNWNTWVPSRPIAVETGDDSQVPAAGIIIPLTGGYASSGFELRAGQFLLGSEGNFNNCPTLGGLQAGYIGTIVGTSTSVNIAGGGTNGLGGNAILTFDGTKTINQSISDYNNASVGGVVSSVIPSASGSGNVATVLVGTGGGTVFTTTSTFDCQPVSGPGNNVYWLTGSNAGGTTAMSGYTNGVWTCGSATPVSPGDTFSYMSYSLIAPVPELLYPQLTGSANLIFTSGPSNGNATTVLEYNPVTGKFTLSTAEIVGGPGVTFTYPILGYHEAPVTLAAGDGTQVPSAGSIILSGGNAKITSTVGNDLTGGIDPTWSRPNYFDKDTLGLPIFAGGSNTAIAVPYRSNSGITAASLQLADKDFTFNGTACSMSAWDANGWMVSYPPSNTGGVNRPDFGTPGGDSLAESISLGDLKGELTSMFSSAVFDPTMNPDKLDLNVHFVVLQDPNIPVNYSFNVLYLAGFAYFGNQNALMDSTGTSYPISVESTSYGPNSGSSVDVPTPRSLVWDVLGEAGSGFAPTAADLFLGFPNAPSAQGLVIGNYGPTPPNSGHNGIAFDVSNDAVWVTNTTNGPGNVTKFNAADGSMIGTYSTGTQPWGVAFDVTQDAVWIANYGDGTVTKLNAANGALISTTASVGSQCFGIAYDSTQNAVWVTSVGSGYVTKIDASGGSIIGNYSTGLSNPAGVCYDVTQNAVWVNSSGSAQVVKFSAVDGSVIGSYPVGNGPNNGIVFDVNLNTIWVANSVDRTLTKLDASVGTVLGTFNVEAGTINGLTYDPTNGCVWVVDTSYGRVIKFEAISGNRDFSYQIPNASPYAIVFDVTHDALWVAQTGIDFVTKMKTDITTADCGLIGWPAFGTPGLGNRYGTSAGGIILTGGGFPNPATLAQDGSFLNNFLNNPYIVATGSGGVSASYTGTPDGASTPVRIMSAGIGPIGNISLTFDGINPISTAITNWNNTVLSQGRDQVPLLQVVGDFTQVPSASSISLSGGTACDSFGRDGSGGGINPGNSCLISMVLSMYPTQVDQVLWDAGYVAQEAASYTGTIAGTSTPVTVIANTPGTSGNVTLTFDGTVSINLGIESWNVKFPSTQVSLSAGDGTQVPSGTGTIPLTGGVNATGARIWFDTGTNIHFAWGSSVATLSGGLSYGLAQVFTFLRANHSLYITQTPLGNSGVPTVSGPVACLDDAGSNGINWFSTTDGSLPPTSVAIYGLSEQVSGTLDQFGMLKSSNSVLGCWGAQNAMFNFWANYYVQGGQQGTAYTGPYYTTGYVGSYVLLP